MSTRGKGRRVAAGTLASGVGLVVIAALATAPGGVTSRSASRDATASQDANASQDAKASGGRAAPGSHTRPAPRAAPGTEAAKVFDDGTLRFTYPASWRSEVPVGPPLPDAGLTFVYLSNKDMGPPCRNDAPACAPVRRLAPGGLYARWSETGLVLWSLQRAPGTPRTVGGQRAKELVARGGGRVFGCPAGTAEYVELQVEESSGSRFAYEMTACLRPPSLHGHLTEVQAMVASTTFPGRRSAPPPSS